MSENECTDGPQEKCKHCGHRRDAHEYVFGSECRKCSCAEFVRDGDDD
jgi:hypothetical protein